MSVICIFIVSLQSIKRGGRGRFCLDETLWTRYCMWVINVFVIMNYLNNSLHMIWTLISYIDYIVLKLVTNVTLW